MAAGANGMAGGDCMKSLAGFIGSHVHSRPTTLQPEKRPFSVLFQLFLLLSSSLCASICAR